MSATATVQYGESILDIPDQTVMLLDMCEAFFGKYTADRLLAKGHVALKSISTQQVVVTLPFEPLPTMDDMYELVVDWTGIEEGDEQYSLHHHHHTNAAAPASSANPTSSADNNDDYALGAPPQGASDDFDLGGDANAAAASGAVGAQNTDTLDDDNAGAARTASTNNKEQQQQQYELALLGALEQMGVAVLITSVIMSSTNTNASDATTTTRRNNDAASLLSLQHHAAHNLGNSALSLGLVAPATTLEQFGTLVYPFGIYSPFTALRNGGGGGVDGASGSAAATIIGSSANANTANTTASKRYSASVLADAMAKAAAEASPIAEGSAITNYSYAYNDAIAARWGADGHGNRTYVAHHQDYSGPSLVRHIQLQQYGAHGAKLMLPSVDDVEFSRATVNTTSMGTGAEESSASSSATPVDGSTSLQAIFAAATSQATREGKGCVGGVSPSTAAIASFLSAAGYTSASDATLASVLFPRGGIYNRVGKH